MAPFGVFVYHTYLLTRRRRDYRFLLLHTGIIFLSAMGTSIAALTIDGGGNPETALGTALLTMTVSTFLVGCGTLIVGKQAIRFAE